MLRVQKAFSLVPEHEKLITILKSCTQTHEIIQIHGRMIKTGHYSTPFPQSKLLAASIVDIIYAAKIFNEIQNPNLFMFNTLMRGYSICVKPQKALLLFNTLRSKSLLLDQFSLVWALKASAQDMAVGSGLAIHGLAVVCGYEPFINVRNTLLHFYCECARICDTQQLFDMYSQSADFISWNTLMSGYVKISQFDMVLNVFGEMHRSGLGLSMTTTGFLCVFSACGNLGNLYEGGALHGYCVKRGWCCEINLVTAMVGMYAKNGSMDSAWKLFDGIVEKDVVLWNCMIEGYARNGHLQESLRLLRLMKLEGMKPNSATLAGVLKTCASSGAIAAGVNVHNYIKEEELDLDDVLGTSLLDMYSKCGFIEKAVDVFKQMQSKDLKSWTAMISGYGFNGQGRNALLLFENMEASGMMPNEVTFLAVLNACNHCGLVTEGKNCFERMVRMYGFSPGIDHYGCMIDLLGRAGMLEEAYKLIRNLPIERDTTAWRALLAACRVYGNVELGETARRTLVQLNDEHPTDSILLSSSYVMHGRWDDIANMREEPTMRKEVGWSSIAIDG